MTAAPLANLQPTPEPVRPESGRMVVLEQILERYHDLIECSGREGIPSDEGAFPRTDPRIYTDSVKEVERLMLLMREERRSQWWHVSERYLRSTRTMRTVAFQHGRWQLEPHAAVVAQPAGWTLELARERGRKRREPQLFSVVVVVWSPAVRLQKVRLGMGWMGEHWSLGHEPMVPDELRVVA